MQTSESVEGIVLALAQARRLFDPLVKRGINAYLKDGSGKNARYVKLEDVWASIEDGLDKSGLVVTQAVGHAVQTSGVVEIIDKQGVVTRWPVFQQELVTRIWHVSGQWIQFVTSLPFHGEKGLSLAQAGGKTITYARRYAITSFFGLVVDDDDDAQPAPAAASKRSGVPEAAPAAGMTANQFVGLWRELFSGDDDAARAALEKFYQPGQGWKDVKANPNWLQETYDTMRAALAALASEQDSTLRDELRGMATSG